MEVRSFLDIFQNAVRRIFNFYLSANKTKGYSTRYINDFNGSSPFEPIYDYDNTKTEIDKVPINQPDTKNDEIYPDPEDFHKKMLNKSRMGNQNHGEDASVIKICKLRLRSWMNRDEFLMISFALNNHLQQLQHA